MGLPCVQLSTGVITTTIVDLVVPSEAFNPISPRDRLKFEREMITFDRQLSVRGGAY